VFCALERREPMFAVMNREEKEALAKKALEAAQQFTSDIGVRLKEQFPDCDVSNEAVFGDIKELLLTQAEKWPADLIVVGSHGRRGLPRLFLGSVSQTILLYGQCSTLIARYQHAHEGVPEFDRNILVAVDESEHSKIAFEWVLNMPWPDDAKIMLLSVSPPLADKYSAGFDALYERSLAQDSTLKKTAQKFLDDCAQRLQSKVGAGKVTVELRYGDAADEILLTAGSWPAGLVVIGSRSHGTTKRLLLGSVSQEVVLKAPCPVEVVKRHA
jgi:nucleotide-binding universal stress UspA family protein